MSTCVSTTASELEPSVGSCTAAPLVVVSEIAAAATTACLTTQSSTTSSNSSGDDETSPPNNEEPGCSGRSMLAPPVSASDSIIEDDDDVISVVSAVLASNDGDSSGSSSEVGNVILARDGLPSPSNPVAEVVVTDGSTIAVVEGKSAASSSSLHSPSRSPGFQTVREWEPPRDDDERHLALLATVPPLLPSGSNEDNEVVDLEADVQLVADVPGPARDASGRSRSPSVCYAFSRRRRRQPARFDGEENDDRGVDDDTDDDDDDVEDSDANDSSVDIVIEEQYEEFDVEVANSAGEGEADDGSSVVELLRAADDDDDDDVGGEVEDVSMMDDAVCRRPPVKCPKMELEEQLPVGPVCRRLFVEEPASAAAGASSAVSAAAASSGAIRAESGSRLSESGGDDSSQGLKSFREKLVMKRKPAVDSKEYLAGKKQCLTGSDDEAAVSLNSHSVRDDVSDKMGAVTATTSTHNHKKRIPTKENPPPELAPWLSTFQCWSNAERLMALDHLIDMCEPTQVRHMMSVIEPQFQRDFISLLPKELALYVLSFLEPKDLLKAAQTCRYWRILAEDNLLWREKCREAGINEVRETLHKKRPKVCPIPSPWKAAYMRQHNIEMNWRFRPIRPPKVLKGHDDHVITCLQFCGTRIVSGSDDNTLKVWSATTGKCLKTLVGHTGGVWSSQMAGSTIVSGSTDRTLKVWNAETGHCVHTLYGHTSTVRCMHLHETKVVSGSRDATLRVWDIESGHCLHVLVGHVAAVRCVQYDGRLVVSGAYDYVVKVWNPEREECLHTLQGHTNRVYSLQFDGVHVVSGSLDTSIRVWDVETGACKHTLMGHQSLTSGMELKNNILVSGNADSTVKVWDITTGQCLQTLSGVHKHNSAVTCLQFNSKFVITSSDDGTVKLWDLKTGEFVRNLVALDSGGSGGVVWRIRASPTKLVCAVGSRNGTEETKLLVLDFDAVATAIEHSTAIK